MSPSNEPRRRVRAILVVEDTEDTREVYMAAFEQAGYEVVGADSVRAALAALRRDRFDLILTDYSLGDGTGMEVLECAAAERLLEGTPAIVCTAHSLLAAPPGVPLLRKPIGVDELLGAVEEAIDRHQKSEAH